MHVAYRGVQRAVRTGARQLATALCATYVHRSGDKGRVIRSHATTTFHRALRAEV